MVGSISEMSAARLKAVATQWAARKKQHQWAAGKKEGGRAEKKARRLGKEGGGGIKRSVDV